MYSLCRIRASTSTSLLNIYIKLIVPVNYIALFSMHLDLFVFFLAKSLFVVFGCTFSTNIIIYTEALRVWYKNMGAMQATTQAFFSYRAGLKSLLLA